ncbi:Aste57867_2477 [Aphanomyces stellatus]|uniref:Aste57867_2477 protein n=1 Tax=Aphanomyces stellatus TaxID=120398 RepID=A0A485KCU4_9STRA|nr:hypothetical protein As57867_002471 [Aphanomyces stellatus]VFT79676.1 Aste57867_2477 [Aphanomyces stellatus]
MEERDVLRRAREDLHAKRRKKTNSTARPPSPSHKGTRGVSTAAAEKIVQRHPGLPRVLNAAKPSASYKWIEQLPRKLCIARKSPPHALLRCRQLIDQGRKLPIEFTPRETAALQYRLRVRMETLWEELKIPHVDRDYFLAVHGTDLESMIDHVQLLGVHYQCTLRALHCIQYREELLQQRPHPSSDVWIQSVVRVSCATVEAIEMWRDTLWYPHAFRSTHGGNYLAKMTSDCASVASTAFCPVLAPLQGNKPASICVGQPHLAPTNRQWWAARILQREAETQAHVQTLQAQWATQDQFVPLLKWDPTNAASTPVTRRCVTTDTDCFVYRPWVDCVDLITVRAMATLQRRWKQFLEARRVARTTQSQVSFGQMTTNTTAHGLVVVPKHRAAQKWCTMRLDRVPGSMLRLYTSKVELHVPARGVRPFIRRADAASLWTTCPRKAAAECIQLAWKTFVWRQRERQKQDKLDAYREMWLKKRKSVDSAGSTPCLFLFENRQVVDLPRHSESAAVLLHGTETHALSQTHARRDDDSMGGGANPQEACEAPMLPCDPAQNQTPGHHHRDVTAQTIQRWYRARRHRHTFYATARRVLQTLMRLKASPTKIQPPPQRYAASPKAMVSRFHDWWTRSRDSRPDETSSSGVLVYRSRVHRAVRVIQHRWKTYKRHAKLAVLRALWLTKRKSIAHDAPVGKDVARLTTTTTTVPSRINPPLACFQLEHLSVHVTAKSTKPTAVACFLHVQVLDNLASPLLFQTRGEPLVHDVVEWNDVVFFLPGLSPTAHVVLTLVGLTIWKKHKFLGQWSGPLQTGSHDSCCHGLVHIVVVHPAKHGKKPISFCNSTDMVTAAVRWSCAAVPTLDCGIVTGYLCSPIATASYVLCLRDDALHVYNASNRATPALRLNLATQIQRCTCDNHCVYLDFVDGGKHMRFVFEYPDGRAAHSWHRLLSSAGHTQQAT